MSMEELLEDLGDHAIAMYRGDSLRVRFAPKWMDKYLKWEKKN